MSETTVRDSFVTLSDVDFETLAAFIESRLGIKMPITKRKLLEARLQKRLRHYGLRSFRDYTDLLFRSEDSYQEVMNFIDEVTTNKTDFFREPDHFRRLEELLRNGSMRGRSGPLRLWSVASSSGEEPYTMAMICEERHRLDQSFSYEITGTDISYKMLKTAVRGVYLGELIKPVPDVLRKRYLLRGTGDHAGTFRVVPQIRNRVSFYRLNLMDGSYGIKQGFDVVFCRNVLIYFDGERQRAIMRKIHALLNPGGYLFMGPTEGMLASFLPLEKVSNNLFRRPEESYA